MGKKIQNSIESSISVSQRQLFWVGGVFSCDWMTSFEVSELLLVFYLYRMDESWL